VRAKTEYAVDEAMTRYGADRIVILSPVLLSSRLILKVMSFLEDREETSWFVAG
jgi:hypothetical protein